jgi:hypothetical protein
MDSSPADQDVQTVIDMELRLLKHEIRAEPATWLRTHPSASASGWPGGRRSAWPTSGRNSRPRPRPGRCWLPTGHGQPRPEADFEDLATEPCSDPGSQPCRLLAAQRTIRHTRKDLLLVETHFTSLERAASSIKNSVAPPGASLVLSRAGP